MLDGFLFLLHNIWYILGFIILSIPFYIWFYKSHNVDLDFKKQKKVSKKSLYLNRIDIIENKVYILIGLCIALVIGVVLGGPANALRLGMEGFAEGLTEGAAIESKLNIDSITTMGAAKVIIREIKE